MIDDLHAAITDAIAAALPGVSVERHQTAGLTAEDVTQYMIRMPAVLVAMLGGTEAQSKPTGQIEVPLKWGAFCLTHSVRDPTGGACGGLAAAVAAAVQDRRFGDEYPVGPMLGLAKIDRMENLSSPDSIKQGFHIWAVSFATRIRVGTDYWVSKQHDETAPSEFDTDITPDHGP